LGRRLAVDQEVNSGLRSVPTADRNGRVARSFLGFRFPIFQDVGASSVSATRPHQYIGHVFRNRAA
jgi:hypothetical protein